MKLEASKFTQEGSESRIEKSLAEIWFKQVEPLYTSMKENSGIVTFVSDKFSIDSFEPVKRIAYQKMSYYKLIKDLNSFSSYPLSRKSQEYIFSISTRLLQPAIKYGYADEAIELLKIVTNKKLVGELSECPETKALTEKTIAEVVAIYGLRLKIEGESHFKNTTRNLINDVLVGKFGEFPNLTPKYLSEVFRTPQSKLPEGLIATVFGSGK